MPVYVMLSKLTEDGAKTVKSNPDRIAQVDQEMEGFGVRVLHQYAVLGEYDFVTVVEAPDNLSVAKASLELGSRGSVRIQTLPAIPTDELISGIR